MQERHRVGEWVVAAASTVVALLTFVLFWRTLLPGQELGDTASFQTTATTGVVAAREGYPLYFALGRVFVELGSIVGAGPAFMLNLASAVYGAAACALLVWLGAVASGSVGGGVLGALLLASSYTFWSQAIIAEVYTLHILLVAATLIALFRWAERPTVARLALVFGIYALSFGNHLSMILLAPGIAMCLFLETPGGARELFRPRVIALAIGFAVLGALQYAPLYATLRAGMAPGTRVAESLEAFWFDVTKTDWRESMILAIPGSQIGDRVAMTWFDARQQFGLAGLVLSVTGLIWLLRARPAIAGVLVAIWGTCTVFAFTYNVGDPYVFYLPAHAMAALMAAGCGGLVVRAIRRPWVLRCILALLLGYPAWRMYDTLPALDRSHDDRPRQMLEGLTQGVGGVATILAADMNWQLQNGLSYYGAATRPDITLFRVTDVLLYLPVLLRDNLEANCEVVGTEPSARLATGAYGPLIMATPDERVPVGRLSDVVGRVPRGAPYVICLLRQNPEVPLDRDDLQLATRSLSGVSMLEASYNVIAGLAGRPPIFIAATERPFRRRLRLGGLDLDIRMESWLATDTIRRAGFGHVIANRNHALFLERGVSFVAFDAAGRVITTAYAAGLYAPHARYRLTLTR